MPHRHVDLPAEKIFCVVLGRQLHPATIESIFFVIVACSINCQFEEHLALELESLGSHLNCASSGRFYWRRAHRQPNRARGGRGGARILRHGPAPLSSPYPDFADTSHPHTQPQGSRLLHPSRSTSNIRTCLRSLCTRQALLRQKLYVSSRPSRSPHQPSRARSANAPARLQHLLAADLGQSSSHPSRTFGADIASHLNFLHLVLQNRTLAASQLFLLLLGHAETR